MVQCISNMRKEKELQAKSKESIGLQTVTSALKVNGSLLCNIEVKEKVKRWEREYWDETRANK